MGATKRAATKRGKPPAEPVTSKNHGHVADLASELQDMRDRVEALSACVGGLSRRAASPQAQPLAEIAASLERTVEEARRGKLDQAKLLAIASAIAKIASLLGEALASQGG